MCRSGTIIASLTPRGARSAWVPSLRPGVQQQTFTKQQRITQEWLLIVGSLAISLILMLTV